MATAKEEQKAAAAATERKTKRRRFVGGDPELERFGLTTDQEYYKQGYVASDDVRALLDEFGLQEREHIQFPFQHIKRTSHEMWSMRIEPAAQHQAEGKFITAHHWVYKREQPEMVAGGN